MDCAYKTLCDPPAPTVAAKCKLPFSGTDCIAAASGNKLQIFTYLHNHLVLIWERHFFGTIFAVFSYRYGAYDNLILGVDNTKVIILKPTSDLDLVEVEWHSFEWDQIPTSLIVRHPTIMRIDPTGECIAMFVAGDWLFFMSLKREHRLRQDADVDRPKTDKGEHSGWDYLTGVVEKQLSYEWAIYRVRDMCFMEGYSRPNLAIMYEPIPTWSVMLPVQKSTVIVKVITPNLTEQRFDSSVPDVDWFTWVSRPLPHNSHTLVPVKEPYGGLLVLSKNALVYMTYTAGLTFELNSLARLDNESPFEVAESGRYESHSACELTSPVYAVLNENNVLLSFDMHHFGVLTLHDNGVDIVDMSVCICTFGEFHPSACVLYSFEENPVVFCGSVVHDSMLLRFSTTLEDEISSSILGTMNESETALYEAIFGTPAPLVRHIPTAIRVDVLDTIYQIGTVSCACPCEWTWGVNETMEGEEIETPVSMALGCGLNESGCLQYLRSGCVLNQIGKLDVAIEEEMIISAFYSQVLDVLVLSSDNTTVVYRTKHDFPTNERVGRKERFVLDSPTIAAGDFGDGFVQITNNRVIYKYRSGEVIDLLTGDVRIKTARVNSKYIVVVCTNSTIWINDGFDYDNGLQKPRLVPMRMSISEGRSLQVRRIAIFRDILFTLDSNDVLHIQSLTEQKEASVIKQFRSMQDLMQEDPKATMGPAVPWQIIEDIAVISMGEMVVLVLLLREGNTIMYQLFEPTEKRGWVLKKIRTRQSLPQEEGVRHGRIVAFDGVFGGYVKTDDDQEISKSVSGAFICGSRSMFMLPENGYPRLLPIPAATFFCQIGKNLFIGCGKAARVANFGNFSHSAGDIETHIIGGSLVQRIHIGQTPRLMCYIQPWSGSIVMITSVPVKYEKGFERLSVDPEEENNLWPHWQKDLQPETPPRDIPEDDVSNLPSLLEDHYELQMITNGRVKNKSDEVRFERHEYVTGMGFVNTLDDYENPESEKRSPYLVIGSSFMCNEPRAMRGALVAYTGREGDTDEYTLTQAISTKVPWVNVDTQENVNVHPMLTPIVGMNEMEGYLTYFAGGYGYHQMELVMLLKGTALKTASFFRSFFYSKQIEVMKNYILFTDLYQGFGLMRWRPYGKKLIEMARDMTTFLPTSSALITSGQVLGGVVYDAFGNVQVFDIDEYAIPSDAFVIRSVFNIGCCAITAGHFPIQNRVSRELSGHLSWFVSNHGQFGCFVPLSDGLVRNKLCACQNSYEKSLLGLSHLGYRSAKFGSIIDEEQKTASPRLIPDMDFLMDLVEGPIERQRECITETSRPELFSAMAEVSNAIHVFE